MNIAFCVGTLIGIPVRNRIGFRLNKRVCWPIRSDVAATCLVAASMCSVGERRFDLDTRLQGAQDGD
jgi:hypothetical protein